MKNFKKVSSLSLSLMISLSALQTQAQASGASVDLRFALKNREMLYTEYKTAAARLNNPEDLLALNAWVSLMTEKDPAFLKAAYIAMQSFVKNQSVIEFASQAFYSNDKSAFKAVLGLYFHQLVTSIWEFSTHPQVDSQDSTKKQAQALLSQSSRALETFNQCIESSSAFNGNIAGLQNLLQSCIPSEWSQLLQIQKTILNEKSYRAANQSLSPTGFLHGNKVELLTQNIYDADFIRYLAPKTALVQKAIHPQLGKAYSQMSVEDFKSLMTNEKSALEDIFSISEGFSTSDHKVWALTKANGEKNIYGQIMKNLKSAEQSIFIDVFFIGGSIGLSLVKELISLSQQKPNLKIYVLNDRKNPLGYNQEMQPVYNYLRAYAEKFSSSRILVLEPKIDLKRTSFPQFMDFLVSDASLVKSLGVASSEFKTQSSFYPKGKSDHSKVIVIDPQIPGKGTAFVGSKNFTDSSGGIAHDEVVQIQGPAVVGIQDSYYYDLFEAILDQKQSNYIQSYAQSSAQSKASTAESQAKDILKPLDFLNRSESNYLQKVASLESLKIPAQGSTPLMLGENNVYGTLRTALPQDVAAIMSAQKQIIISDQFLYDPTVIKALRTRALEYGSQVRIYILLASQDDPASPEKKFVRIPNIIFLQDLLSTGKAEIRWKKIPSQEVQALADVKAKDQVTLSPEYHLKGLSVDGVTANLKSMCGSLSNDRQVSMNPSALQSLKTAMGDSSPRLISGSANKDVMTMMGGFREFQVVIFDKEASIKHDCLFWSRFDSPEHSITAVGANGQINESLMNLPEDLVAKGLTPERFNQFLKRFMLGFYNSSISFFSSQK